MKRTSVIVLALTAATSAFAYYDDYGYSSYSKPDVEMPWWIVLMSIVMIVWGILNIILFFKIWGMTNNIKAMKEDQFGQELFPNKWMMARYLRKNLVQGNTEKVKRMLLKNFLDDVVNAYSNMKTGGYETGENGESKWVEYKEKNLNTSIRPYVENLKMQYAKFGEQIPAYIEKMQTFGDYYDLFDEKDLIVEIAEDNN